MQTVTSRYLSLSRGVLIPFHRASFAPLPFSARASAIRSRTCGRQRLAFLAVSATGGTRKPTVQGELAKPQVLTEGLYPLTGQSVYAVLLGSPV